MNVELDASTDLRMVRCVTRVRRDGRHRQVTCSVGAATMAGDEPDFTVLQTPTRMRSVDGDLAYQVARVLGGVRLVPARVGDEAVEVEFPFSVMLEADESRPRLIVAPNHGLELMAHGLSYSAPQRIHARQPGCFGRQASYPPVIVADFHVDARGRAETPIVIAGAVPEVCAQRVRDWLRESRYVAARDDRGEPIRARHVEALRLNPSRRP